MKQSLIILSLVVLFVLHCGLSGNGCGGRNIPSRAAMPGKASPSSITNASLAMNDSAIANATYFMPRTADLRDTIQLRSGMCRQDVPLGSGYVEHRLLLQVKWAYGDLNGDGASDAAVVLAQSTGGSGEWITLNALVDSTGRPHHLASFLMGDRIRVTSVSIRGRTISVRATIQRYDQGACCPDSAADWQFRLKGRFLEKVSDGPY